MALCGWELQKKGNRYFPPLIGRERSEGVEGICNTAFKFPPAPFCKGWNSAMLRVAIGALFSRAIAAICASKREIGRPVAAVLLRAARAGERS